jgi:Spy/CpxP family protein refolding chaperone
MKKLFVTSPILLALCLSVPQVRAQQSSSATTVPTQPVKKSRSSGAHKSSGRAEAELADLSTSLTLTDDQKAKIKPILDDEHEKIHALKQANTGSTDDQKAKSKAIRNEANSQIRGVLTPDQQTKFQSISKRGHKKAADTQGTGL